MAPDRYFIALLPPQEMQDYANQIRQHFSDRYNSRKAFNSPPHITLIPPFDWSQDPALLQQALTHFAQTRPKPTEPLTITLSGFGSFPPNVIYINVLREPALLALQTSLAQQCQTSLGVSDRYSNQTEARPFIPHMTVAFRDLTEENFRQGWLEFEHKSLDLNNQRDRTYQFHCDRLTLLRHDGQQAQPWQPYWDVRLDGDRPEVSFAP